MEPITLGALALAVGGELAGPGADPARHVGPGVVIDSRQADAGALFVALPGERVDGHDYVAVAAAAGAGAALVTRAVDADLPQVVVGDTATALADLATDIVARARAAGLVVVGVTGSSGKTSTKDLIAAVLEAAGPTVAPPGSFNNEIGAPLTACRVDTDARYLVAEMGARGIGHVAWLCRVTPPTIGAVLNVGHAHLGEFGSVDAIALA
ncbi:MAG: Mur ligase domain-containing protein, partial [Propionibacteriaceae bacterium]|nr:Mur ligase domain-containing protein [Propionibacteriaceae bacterium]